MTDETLIRQFVTEGSPDAFQQIVDRYLKVVYGICLREVRNPDMAQDVTQTVFVLLAQKAGRLRRGTVLSGWLFTTARFASKVALRNEMRRRHYETQAVDQMTRYEEHLRQAEAAVIIEPWLNEALAGLKAQDREALLMRYAEQRSLREIGEQCGISENGAQMRVTRALEKLRRGLRKQGVESPDAPALSVVLIGLLTGSLLTLPSSVSAAAIAHTVPSVLSGIAGTTATGARLIQMTQGVNRTMRILQIKTAAVVIAGCLTIGMCTAKLAHSGSLKAVGIGVPSAKVLAAKAANPTQYTVTDLGILPGFPDIMPTSINNKGEIVGRVGDLKGGLQPFYYRDGTMHGIAMPPGYGWVLVNYINDQGMIVGSGARNPMGGTQQDPLLGSKDGLTVYTPPASITNMRFKAVNDKGVIIGGYQSVDGAGHDALTFFILSDGNFSPIPTAAGLADVGPINNNGDILGVKIIQGVPRACSYSQGKTTLLPILAGYQESEPRGINDRGDVTGINTTGKLGVRAFLYHNGSMTDLGTVNGFSNSAGQAINAAGVVVGFCYNGMGDGRHRPAAHAAVFKSGRAIDLNTLIDPASGWLLTEALAINDSGWIIGLGVHNGAQRAFLLKPKS